MLPLENPSSSYRVLARKYRPERFGEIVGQQSLVNLLTKALLQDRLAHGFLFSGMRGVGKTTVARLLACALNCLSLKREEQAEPCGVCDSCVSFKEGKHLDIVEMDAASHTSVDDIREILESCRYQPLLGRYKVFLIDEIHMLSKSAFNALLKTLEEPPAHVKFIFATTEPRKMPSTVLSRCMRFELKPMDPEVLVPLLAKLSSQEGVTAEEEALFVLARAGAGSARDSLSLLDQAIVLATSDDGLQVPHIVLESVQRMLGIVDRSLLNALLQSILKGDGAVSLEQANKLGAHGADPLMILDELSTMVYQLSSLKVGVHEVLRGLNGGDQSFLKGCASEASLPALGRLWQMLLKGVQEVRNAAFPQKAFEMLLIRLAYVAPLKTPDQWLTLFEKSPDKSTSSSSDTGVLGSQSLPPQSGKITTFQRLMAVVSLRREALLETYLTEHVVILDFEFGRIHLHLRDSAPQNFLKLLETFLFKETGQKWHLTVRSAGEEGGQTVAEKKLAQHDCRKKAFESDPLVAQARDLFPGLVLEDVQPVPHPLSSSFQKGEGA